MRQTFIVSYDIGCPKRLRRVYRLMRGWGDHIQLSVFRCEMTARELVELRSRLNDVINSVEDQVLFVDVGPVEGRGSTSIRAIGKVYTPPERRAIVV
ncbi:MAG: CRISPR-associated endonuclease Cas2 [Myxococcales bacterium 68-20]|nr:CRISPR-associated endonuclease Cas2 [Myxococcales bacterium]OJY22054.1 MAG: CRISPR-associated endonuclease Cas2 [Myxococcales bacterium 68-20]